MTDLTFSLGTLAAEFGVSRDVLRRIIAEASVAPTGKRSGHPVYRLRDVLRAVQQQGEATESNPHARLALARAVKYEDEIRVRRGELIERFDHEQDVARILKLAALAFETAIDVCERDVGLSPLQAMRLERHFDEIRDRIAEEIDGQDVEAEIRRNACPIAPESTISGGGGR